MRVPEEGLVRVSGCRTFGRVVSRRRDVGSRQVGCSVEGGTRLLEAKPFLRAQSIRSDVSSHLPVPIRKLKHRVLLGHVQKPVFEFDRVVSHI